MLALFWFLTSLFFKQQSCPSFPGSGGTESVLGLHDGCDWSPDLIHHAVSSSHLLHHNGGQGACHLLQSGVIWGPLRRMHAGIPWMHRDSSCLKGFLIHICFEIYIQYPVLLCGYSDYRWSSMKLLWPSCLHLFMPVDDWASVYLWSRRSWQFGKLKCFTVWQQIPHGQIYTSVKWLASWQLQACGPLCWGGCEISAKLWCAAALSSLQQPGGSNSCRQWQKGAAAILSVFLHGLLLLASQSGDEHHNLWWASGLHIITLICKVHIGVVQGLELLGLKADKT